MRSRARRTTQTETETSSPTPKRFKQNKRFDKRKWAIALSLVTIFFLVLFLNTYFNLTSGVGINPDGETLSDTFYLSGPDPYYNLRLVKQTVETGIYPYYGRNYYDPLLNYPMGTSGARAPLLNMMAIGFSKVLNPLMSESDALGYSMQFIPALFGALIIFPVYFIGKNLFGRKEGLIAALFVAIIPIHIGSGHGSAYGLFDHDSFNLLLFFCIFYFLIKSITNKSTKTMFGILLESDVYALLAGVCIAALSMTWVESRYIFSVIAVYAVVQMIVDIFRNQINPRFVRSIVLLLFSGYLLSFPVLSVRYGGFNFDLSFFLPIGILLFGIFYALLDRKKIPWLLSLPTIFIIGLAAAIFLFFVRDLANAFPFLGSLNGLAEIIYGSGIYGDKVDATIAEAGTYSISRTVMSYGPALYWLAWSGFVLLLWEYVKQKGRRDYFFIIILFIINIWLASTAGRFLNDQVPLIAILAAWVVFYVISKVDYRQMVKNIRNAGGGFKGLRRGIKIYHVLGILFVTFLVIMPNSLLAFDSAIPSAVTQNGSSNMKVDYFGEDFGGAFGSSSYKEQYWVNALSWFAKQDTEVANPADRPGFISWWDYGFYEVAVGDHPTVADNFQDGIPPASNFHTAKSEKEGVAVLITRLLEGHVKENNNAFSTEVSNTLTNHLGKNASRDIELWITDPETSPSYHQPIGSEYDADLSKELLVGEQYPQNAYYQDIVQLINASLTDEEVTWLYHDIQDVTGWSIRYYGVEGYDAQIFNIFAFLSDKSLILNALRSGGGTKLYNAEDDFIVIKYVGYRVNADGTPGTEDDWTSDELNALSDSERRRIVITDTKSENKPDYYKTMFYRTYIGDIPKEFENQVFQLPCWGMKHFTAEFVSDYPYFNTRRGAVVIAKYYEGAHINGSVRFNNASYNCDVVIQKDISYFGTTFGIDHDSVSTDANGSFSLIAPGGEISVQLRRNTELGANAFILKTITLNSTEDPLFAPISEEEAMRKGSFIRELGNITIEPAQVTGTAYENLDNDSESFNESLDLPLSDVEVTLIEITEFDESGQPIDTGEFEILSTDATGTYTAEGLIPGIYVIRARINDFIIHENYLFVTSGNNTYDIKKPQPAAIEGITYIDGNDNAKYDIGEETADINVQLLYTTLEGTTMDVKQVKTGINGAFGFTDMIPGVYTLNATKENKTTGYLDYIIEQDVSLIENTTVSQNLSLSLAPINIRGITRHDTIPVGGIRVTFSPDTQMSNNTAEEVSVTSSTTGSYSTNLLPGIYNVTVDFTVEEGIFSFSGDLTLIKGQGIQTYNLDLTKESITITGTTRYDTTPKTNMTIIFQPSSEVENNTAQYSTTISDEKGNYHAELRPGTYTVEIDETITENNQNMTYTYSAQLVITMDSPEITYNITLTKEEQ